MNSQRARSSACTILLCAASVFALADAGEPDLAEEALSAPAHADPEGELVEFYGTRVGDDLEPLVVDDVDPWIEPWFRDYDTEEEVERARAMIEYLRKRKAISEQDTPEPEPPPD